MLVFESAGLVFFASTKTGSSGLERTLSPHAEVVFRNPPRLKHMRPQDYFRNFHNRLCNTRPGEIESVALMRDPIDWLGSWYRYRSRDELLQHPNSTRGISFDDFVDAYLQDEPPAFANLQSQFRFLRVDINMPTITHLFDYAKIDQVYRFFEQRLDRTLDRIHSNVSPRQDLQLSADVEARLRQKCSSDFALYAVVQEESAKRDQ